MPRILTKPRKREARDRVERALSRVESNIRLRLRKALNDMRNERALTEVAKLIERGQYEQAIAFAEANHQSVADTVVQGWILAGLLEAAFVSNVLGETVSFDQINQRAVDAMRQSQSRLVRGLNAEARASLNATLRDSLARGLNPYATARELRATIGLTARQTAAVINFRRMLENLDSDALTRQLRDRRFDRTVRRAISEDTPLTRAEIDRMVESYRARALAHRAEVLARTEALRATHAGIAELYRQAIERRQLDGSNLVQIWVTARDERVRGSHRTMHGQPRPFGEPFVSGRGNLLRFPGDIRAPGSETINCRCHVITRIRQVRLA